MKSPLTHFIGMLAIFFLVGGSYVAWYKAISYKSQQVVEVQQMIDDANKNAKRIALARAALAEIADDEASVRSYFVPESGVVSFIATLEKLGILAKSEVKVLSVSTAGSPAQPLLQLALSIAGSFDAVMRTVGAIEYAPYDISVTKLSVAQDAKNTWRAEMSLSVGSAPVATTRTP